MKNALKRINSKLSVNSVMKQLMRKKRGSEEQSNIIIVFYINQIITEYRNWFLVRGSGFKKPKIQRSIYKMSAKNNKKPKPNQTKPVLTETSKSL